MFVQTTIVFSMLIIGGVFKQVKANSFKSFSDTVNNRSINIENQMKGKWTNLQPYLSSLQDEVLDKDLSNEDIIKGSVNSLIGLLRATDTTGAFMILKNTNPNDSRYEAIYLRDYDPSTNSYHNDDIFLLVGMPELAREYKLPLDVSWEDKLSLNEDNRDFYDQAYRNHRRLSDKKNLGYWSKPFKISEEDSTIITYSMPLESKSGELFGVIGVEMTTGHLAKHLPPSELQGKETMGYIIAGQNPASGDLDVLVTTNNIQKRFIDESGLLKFKALDKKTNVSLLLNNQIPTEIYAAISKIENDATVSENSQSMYIVGFSRADDLLKYSNKIINTIQISLLVALSLGIIGGIVGSQRMSRPIIELVNQVTRADKNKNLYLEPSHIRELDQLSAAMVEANESMLDSASRISRIIELVGLPMAAFEINHEDDSLFVTKNFFDILGVEKEAKESITTTEGFMDFLGKILVKPKTEEEDIYRTTEGKERWFRLKLKRVNMTTSGFLQDVSEEIMEKEAIKRDRDLDPLTGILNRRSFKSKYNDWKENHKGKVAALAMFDLDSLKEINDRYGHKWGDLYIVESVKSLKSIADSSKYVLGRRSGDEFIMLLYDFDSKEQIRAIMKRFYIELDNRIVEFPQNEKRNIEISGGFVWIKDVMDDYNQLMHYADEAMYHSKKYNKGYYTEAKSVGLL